MSDLDEILAGNEPAPEPQPEPAVEPEAPEPAQAQEPEPEPAKEPEAAQEPEPAREPETVPVSVVAELRRELRELRQAKEEPVKAPDVLDDPAGYAGHIQATVQHMVQNERLNMSEAIARETLGDKVVDDALAAFQASGDPAAAQAIRASAMPYQQMVKWHKQQQVVREIGDDPTAWREREREKIRQEVQADLVAKQVKEAAGKPAPSLANTNGSGGTAAPAWSGPVDLDDLL